MPLAVRTSRGTVAFELASGAAPAERIPPRATVVYHTLKPQYFGKGR